MPLRPDWLTSRPIAHRGLHDLAAGRPENSVAAFEAAAEAGHPCELDVQLTSSGELIVLHDYDLSRVTGMSRPSVTLTAADLASTRLFGGDQQIPLLAQVLDCVHGRVPLLLELKRGDAVDPRALVQAVLESLRSRDGLYALSSFDPFSVRLLRGANTAFPVGQISGLLRSSGRLRRLAGRVMITNVVTRPDFISYELAGLPSRIVEVWRNRGVPVLAWTVKTPEDEQKARHYADNFFFDVAPSRKEQ